MLWVLQFLLKPARKKTQTWGQYLLNAADDCLLPVASCWRERVARRSGTAASSRGLGPIESWCQILLWPWASRDDPTQQKHQYVLNFNHMDTSTWAYFKHMGTSCPIEVILRMCLILILCLFVRMSFKHICNKTSAGQLVSVCTYWLGVTCLPQPRTLVFINTPFFTAPGRASRASSGPLTGICPSV